MEVVLEVKTFTAQMLVGSADLNHGGVGRLEGRLFLTENSRPVR